MFEPSNLVPNQNKIMEEYTKKEEEAVQVTQDEIGQEEIWQEEERAEARAEPEQLVKEIRKRKRGAEHSKEKGSNWVSALAYFA